MRATNGLLIPTASLSRGRCALHQWASGLQGCSITLYRVASGRKQLQVFAFLRQREDVVWLQRKLLPAGIPPGMQKEWGALNWAACWEAELSSGGVLGRGKDRTRERKQKKPTSEILAPDFSWLLACQRSPQLLKGEKMESWRIASGLNASRAMFVKQVFRGKEGNHRTLN